MITLAQNVRPDPRCAIAGYQALDSIGALMMTGTIADRRALLDQLLENNIVDICLTKLRHPLCIHRNLAVNNLRVLSAEGFLGDKLSPLQASQIMIAMARHTLAGPQSYVHEMQLPVTSWQSQMFMGKVGVSCLLPLKS